MIIPPTVRGQRCLPPLRDAAQCSAHSATGTLSHVPLCAVGEGRVALGCRRKIGLGGGPWPVAVGREGLDQVWAPTDAGHGRLVRPITEYARHSVWGDAERRRCGLRDPSGRVPRMLVSLLPVAGASLAFSSSTSFSCSSFAIIATLERHPSALSTKDLGNVVANDGCQWLCFPDIVWDPSGPQVPPSVRRNFQPRADGVVVRPNQPSL